MLNNKIEEKIISPLPKLDLQLNLTNGIPNEMMLNRETERDLMVKDYCYDRFHIHTFRKVYDNFENDIMDQFESYIHNSIYEIRCKVRQLEDEVVKDILTEWGYDVTDEFLAMRIVDAGIYYKSEYEYRFEGDREYLWLVRGDEMKLISIKTYKDPTINFKDTLYASIGFDLYLSRKVEEKENA